MNNEMQLIQVQVQFTGTVEVSVPLHLPVAVRQSLAQKLAIAKVVATTENPDAPEDDACQYFAAECNLAETEAERAWDASTVDGVAGTWKLTE